MYILLCGFPPFASDNNSQEELFDKILAGQFEFLPPYFDHVSMAARDLIEKMLQVDANRRYSAQEMLEHPWMKTVSDLPSITVLPDFLDKIIDRVATNDKMYVGVAVCVTPYIQQLYNYYIILVVY